MFKFLDNFANGFGNLFSVDNGYSPDTPMSSPDAIKTGGALSDLGFFGNNSQGVSDLNNSVKAFQKTNGLKVDGVINPGGPTENAISNALSQKSVSATDPLEGVANDLPYNVTVSKPESSKPDQQSWTASASFDEPTKPKKAKLPKIDPMTGLTDPLASAPKGKIPMAKQWEEVAKMQKQKATTAIIPKGDTVQQRIQSMMRDKRYGDKSDIRLRDHIVKQFQKAYPGEVQYDETGKMIQAEAVIQPDEVEPFDPDHELTQYEWDLENPKRIWLEEEKPAKAPARKKAILGDGEADFNVHKNPKADGKEPIYEIDQFEEVSKYDSIIEQKAEEVGVEPDELRAIIYMESTHGYYDKPLEWIDMNKSLRPMNVYASYWKELGYSREDLKDPAKNIEAGAKILKRLKEKMPDASIREISTLYNNLNAEQVNDYGAQVERIYKEKPWRK